MKYIFNISLILVSFSILQSTYAQGNKFWQVQNRLRLEYDDNVWQTETDTDDSFKIIEEMEFNANLNLENTFIGFSYRPSVVWWSDRDEDDTDLHHYLTATLNQEFTPRISLQLRETFIRAELPELIESGSPLREENDYNQNDVNANLSIALAPQSELTLSGRYIILRYDEDDLAMTRDYDLYVAGATLGQQFGSATEGRLEFRAEKINYDQAETRDSDSFSGGVAVDQTFSPNLIASGRAGGTFKEFDSAEVKDTSAPYFNVSVTALPSPATRISVGAGYSLSDASIAPYVNQERTKAFASIAHDLTARISLFLSGTYTLGEYDAEEVTEGSAGEDGDEEYVQISTRASYQVNRSNWLEASYQFTDFTSDLTRRTDYDQNRVSVGWRTAL